MSFFSQQFRKFMEDPGEILHIRRKSVESKGG